MPVYRPSCRVRLQLRLDEGADTAAINRGLERKPPSGAALKRQTPTTSAGRKAALRQNLAQQSAVTRQARALAAEEVLQQKADLDIQREGIEAPQAGAVPAGLEQRDQDQRAVIFDVIPESVTVSRNGLRDASTAEITFDYRDVPIDPRAVRSTFVSVALGQVSEDDYEAGMVRGVKRDDGSLLSFVERVPGQEAQPRNPANTTRFVGYVDEWHVEHGDDGGTVNLKCRDVSAVLRDQPLPRGVTIDLEEPIAVGVQQLIDRFATSRGMTVVVGNPDPSAADQGFTEEGPIPAKVLPTPLKPRRGKRARGRRTVGKNQKVWELIESTCIKVGLIPIMRGFTLFLAPPRGVFGSQTIRKMVWGRNLANLEFSRKASQVYNKTVEVRSLDPSRARTLWARSRANPGEPTSGVLGETDPVVSRASNVSPGGKSEEQVQVIPVPGIADLAVLEGIAKATAEQIARQEIEGAFATHDLESFRTGASDEAGLPADDLLNLDSGDTIQILIGQSVPVTDEATGATKLDESISGPGNLATSLQELEEQSIAKRTAYLESLGMSERTARRLARAQEQIKLSDTFRVGSVNLNWTAEDGVSIDGSFYNYIAIREDEDAVEQTPQPLPGARSGRA